MIKEANMLDDFILHEHCEELYDNFHTPKHEHISAYIEEVYEFVADHLKIERDDPEFPCWEQCEELYNSHKKTPHRGALTKAKVLNFIQQGHLLRLYRHRFHH